MNINEQNVDIDDLVSEKYMHKNIKNDIFLSEYQIEVLLKYGIDPNKMASMSEILYMIDEILDDDPDADDLDNIANEIQEFNYYHNTNK